MYIHASLETAQRPGGKYANFVFTQLSSEETRTIVFRHGGHAELDRERHRMTLSSMIQDRDAYYLES